MYQIYVESVKNPQVYRVFQVFPEQTLFDLEFVIAAGFDELDTLDSRFEVQLKNGQPINKIIYTFPEEDKDLNSGEELLEEWLVQPGDQLLYCAKNKFEAKVRLEKILEERLEFEVCIAGQGSLQSPRKKNVDLEELNLNLSLKQVMMDLAFEEIDNYMDPDYETLLQLSNAFNKMKPWTFFNNEDIIAIELEKYEEVFYVSVMGAAHQEFGLMIYDEENGYELLADILYGKQLAEDFHLDLSGLTVNFVDRAELEQEDYQLIKDCGMTFRGKNKWIQFRSYEPGVFPRIPAFSDVELLKTIVQAMIQVTQKRMQGWHYPVVPMHTYPAFKISEFGTISQEYIMEVNPPAKGEIEIEITDIERAQFKRKPKVALQLEFDLFYLPHVVPSDEDENRLIYPVVCVAFDRTTGEALSHDILPFPKFEFIQQQMFWGLLKEMPVRPNKVYVNKGTKEVLAQLAKSIGVELVMSELPNVQNFKKFMANTPPID